MRLLTLAALPVLSYAFIGAGHRGGVGGGFGSMSQGGHVHDNSFQATGPLGSISWNNMDAGGGSSGGQAAGMGYGGGSLGMGLGPGLGLGGMPGLGLGGLGGMGYGGMGMPIGGLGGFGGMYPRYLRRVA